jgi:hypothetical protein
MSCTTASVVLKKQRIGSTRVERLGKARLVGKRGREEQQGMPSVVRLSKEGNKLIPKRARRLLNPPSVRCSSLSVSFPPLLSLLIFKPFPFHLPTLLRKLILFSQSHSTPLCTASISSSTIRHVPRCSPPRTTASLRDVPAPTPRCTSSQPPTPAYPQPPRIHGGATRGHPSRGAQPRPSAFRVYSERPSLTGRRVRSNIPSEMNPD